MTIDKDTVLSALRAEDVARHLGIEGQWRGRWLRSRRCMTADHDTESFGLSRDGFWHCFACDKGGDLLRLLALAENLTDRADFPALLAIAAKIAGVDDAADDWGAAPARPPAKARPALPPLPPLPERVALAKRRAAWAWDRLVRHGEMPRSPTDLYLRHHRTLDPVAVRLREDIRETPLRCTMEEMCKSAELKSLAYLFAAPALALPVRSVEDGRLVDIRVRRFEPKEGQPKIVGMLGGVTTGPAEAGRPRQLVGCYGHPESVDSDLVIIVEGALDYLTALQIWPNGQVLGAVDAGSFALVAAHAARELARRDKESRILIVEQNDTPGVFRDGTVRIGAADESINENPNAAAKACVRILGPRRVGWLFCEDDGKAPIKDLNDLARARGADIAKNHVRWWAEIGQAA